MRAVTRLKKSPSDFFHNRTEKDIKSQTIFGVVPGMFSTFSSFCTRWSRNSVFPVLLLQGSKLQQDRRRRSCWFSEARYSFHQTEILMVDAFRRLPLYGVRKLRDRQDHRETIWQGNNMEQPQTTAKQQILTIQWKQVLLMYLLSLLSLSLKLCCENVIYVYWCHIAFYLYFTVASQNVFGIWSDYALYKCVCNIWMDVNFYPGSLDRLYFHIVFELFNFWSD